MNLNARLSNLETRHRLLEEEIHEEEKHPSHRDFVVAHLKKKKLMLKDEIDQLRDRHS